MDTYLQYVRRDLKIGDIEKGEQLAWQAPVGLGTSRPLTAAYAPKPGDRIYLVSTLGDGAPPALDALIAVVPKGEALYPRRVAALARAKSQVFAAGPGSRWFPMLDATELLERLRARRGRRTGPVLGVAADKNGRLLSCAQRLQGARTLRRLLPESARAIRASADEHLRRPVFISYRSLDGSRLAGEAANYLARHGIPVWYDRWSISIRLDDIDRRNSEGQLEENIPVAIGDCSVIVKVKTPAYGASAWTQKEQRWSEGRSVVELRSAQPDLTRLGEVVSRLRAAARVGPT